jgi:DNA polymerase-3 subunit epsilon
MSDKPWFAGPMTAFDLESTGVDTEQAHIVTAAVIDLGGGRPTTVHSWLAAVEIDIPEGASAIHGISTEHARKNGRPPTEVLDEVAEELARSLMASVPVVGHNVVYDFTLLDRELRRKGLQPVVARTGGKIGPVICSRVLDQHVLPFRRRVSPTQGPRTLQTTAGVYGLPWDAEAAHGCEYDAMQAARIVYRIGQIAHTAPSQRPSWVQAERSNRFNDVAGLDLPDLYMAQQRWAFDQAASLQEYLRKSDATAVVEGAWPLVPVGGDQ